MRRLIKAIGFIAGVAAVVWMVRERLVTLTVAREPEPPVFRTPQSDADDLTEVKGIGPTYAERLNGGGIRTFSHLAMTSASRVADLAGVSVSRAEAWIGDAGEIARS